MSDAEDLEKLNAAINEFAHTQRDELDQETNFVVSNVLLVWEQVAYDGEDVMARFRYSIPTQSTGSAALGLVVAAKKMLNDDLLEDGDDDG